MDGGDCYKGRSKYRWMDNSEEGAKSWRRPGGEEVQYTTMGNMRPDTYHVFHHREQHELCYLLHPARYGPLPFVTCSINRAYQPINFNS